MGVQAMNAIGMTNTVMVVMAGKLQRPRRKLYRTDGGKVGGLCPYYSTGGLVIEFSRRFHEDFIFARCLRKVIRELTQNKM
jgi:hypothetical protein